jgi:hypothetical protein
LENFPALASQIKLENSKWSKAKGSLLVSKRLSNQLSFECMKIHQALHIGQIKSITQLTNLLHNLSIQLHL